MSQFYIDFFFCDQTASTVSIPKILETSWKKIRAKRRLINKAEENVFQSTNIGFIAEITAYSVAITGH